MGENNLICIDRGAQENLNVYYTQDKYSRNKI